MSLRNLAFVLVVSACSGAGETPIQATVEVDVFSGRPNPSWQATPAEARQLFEKIRGLVRLEGVAPPEGRLGYRGFLLLIGTDSNQRHYEVGSGLVVERPSPGAFTVWRDDGVEALLLDQARRHE